MERWEPNMLLVRGRCPHINGFDGRTRDRNTPRAAPMRARQPRHPPFRSPAGRPNLSLAAGLAPLATSASATGLLTALWRGVKPAASRALGLAPLSSSSSHVAVPSDPGAAAALYRGVRPPASEGSTST